MKKKFTCIACGKKIDFQKKLPHGTISLCNEKSCFDRFCLETQNSVPIAWVGTDDFVEHNLFTEKELKDHEEYIIDVADAVSDALWSNGFGEIFSDLMDFGAAKFEEILILNMPKKELPLYLEHVKYPNNKDFLIQRMNE